jgi:hypothetical protein
MWTNKDPSVPLKTADLPPWREDWQDFLDNCGIDVFKMHGREAPSRLWETVDIIKKFAAGEDILFETFKNFVEETNLIDKPINIWREKIKTCKFECWDCQYCDKIWTAKKNPQVDEKIQLVVDGLIESVTRPVDVDIPGLTSQRVKQLLNYLGAGSKHYLEVGSYLGATLASTIKDNTLTAYAVDHWSTNVQPANGIAFPENSKATFVENAKKYKGNNVIKVFDSNFINVNKSEIANVDLFFYDGDHSEIATRAAVKYFAECFADTAILIFDDANWSGVVSGAMSGINDTNFDVLYEKKVLNSQEDPEQWWNGLFILVIKRK